MSEGNNATTKLPCPHCGKLFRGQPGVYSHIKAKHGGKGKGAYRPARDDYEESFADRAVQAEIDRARGRPGDDDWLLP